MGLMLLAAQQQRCWLKRQGPVWWVMGDRAEEQQWGWPAKISQDVNGMGALT